jgi:LPXTG-site transpeptidase (sortase) family protein
MVLAISLAIVGAAVTADNATGNGQSTALQSQSVPLPQGVDDSPSDFVSRVPVRNGELLDDTPDAGPDPVAVRIGDIALDAPVLAVGVDDQNQLAVPAADTVGWYQFSATPGDPGATVLAAHVDYGGRPGAFFNLAELRPGDRVEVELSDGSVLPYRVTGNTQYDKTRLPAEELFRKDGSPVLQLITCGGSFDPAGRTYLANVVVTAVPDDRPTI